MCSIFLFILINYCKVTLRILVLFFRHGARDALGKYSTFNQKPEIGYGQLTDVGLREHFILGEKNKNQYNEFFMNLLQKNINAYTSNKKRTQHSLMANFYGIFKDFENISNYIPFKVDNYIFRYDEKKCSKYYNKSVDDTYVILENLRKTKFFDKLILSMKNSDLFKKNFKDKINEDIKLLDLYYYLDTLISNYHVNFENKQLVDLYYDYFNIIMSLFEKVKIKTNNLQKFFDTLKSNLDNKTENKLIIFSGHDTNIIQIINLLFEDHFDCSLKYFNFKYNFNLKPDFTCLRYPNYASMIT